MAIKFLSPIYRVQMEMPSLKCNTCASNAFGGGIRKLMIYKAVSESPWNSCDRFFNRRSSFEPTGPSQIRLGHGFGGTKLEHRK